MPRVSMKHEDAMGVGFFQSGNIEILKSVCAIHQFPPNSKTGEQSDPFTAVRWGFRRLDDNWEATSEDGEMEFLNIRLGKTDNIRPGNLDEPDNLDSEPEDLGSEVDTEGNSVYGEEGAKVFGSWGAMEESLRKANFKPAIIERSYLPDFVGMKCHLDTQASGRKYTSKKGEEKEEQFLVCTKIHTFPYDKKAAKPAGKSVSKPTSKPAAVEASAGDSDIQTTLAEAIADPQAPGLKSVVKSGTTSPVAKFRMQMQMELVKRKADKDTISAALAVLKDNDQLAELGSVCGFEVDAKKDTVTFA